MSSQWVSVYVQLMWGQAEDTANFVFLKTQCPGLELWATFFYFFLFSFYSGGDVDSHRYTDV